MSVAWRVYGLDKIFATFQIWPSFTFKTMGYSPWWSKFLVLLKNGHSHMGSYFLCNKLLSFSLSLSLFSSAIYFSTDVGIQSVPLTGGHVSTIWTKPPPEHERCPHKRSGSGPDS